ncbi:hydrolase [Streptomyces cinnamoneus]|uniref:Hydrolase n=1 Tax=Streptomyces cinnamoneus TaxID=53446 RepID=A0A2G1XL75_STRCJ|nr:VOC family protein [Streptomyces cinnamoneus]PHQ51118.1 hydrolase [Streptomyces cinnamoneus]PHQ51990.1 hydrolase [Streptomyces cinnamoneus]PHQ51993.1 hydrolase [Streptomyces cinnamoneus]PPT13659.1 VOC family protein [Streptomyces cinnamoneus]
MSTATDGIQAGMPCWVDAMLSDVEAGKRFYGELFGWTFEDAGSEYGHYTHAFHDGKNVAALAPKPDGRMPTTWSVYFASDDATATAGRIRAAGGQIVTGPVAVGPFGTMLMAADPGGAVFGVWQAGSHKGFEKRGEPGSYGWAEVWTWDAKAVDPFYEAVFGFNVYDVSEEASVDFAIWTPGGAGGGAESAVGGRVVMDDRYPKEMPAHFLTYFVVEDCDAVVRAVQRMRGRVRREPQDTPYGRFAVVADDQGADFAVIDLSQPERPEGE